MENHETHFNSASDIKGRIISMDVIISYQEEEIMKTEVLISRLQNCIIEQNKALFLFKNEKRRLEEERNKAENIPEKSIIVNTCQILQPINDKSKNVSDREDGEIIDKLPDCIDNLKRKSSSNILCCSSKKLRSLPILTNECNETALDNCYCVTNGYNSLFSKLTETIVINKDKTKYRKILIPQIGPLSIKKIVKFKDDICLGGSGGILLKYRHPNVYPILNTYKEDIEQIEVVKRRMIYYLVAFTRSRVLIFDDRNRLIQEIALHCPGNVFNDISLIYIPQSNGVIKKLYTDDFVIKDHVVHKHGNIRCFVPGSGKNKQALISLEDSLLYTSDKNDLKSLSAIENADNIKGVLRVRFCNFLCYSHEKIWFLNSEFDKMKIVKFEDGIKFIDVAFAFGAVVDCKNSVHLYRVLDNGRFDKEMSNTSIDGNVTAVTVMNNCVMLAVDNAIISLDTNM